MRAAITLPRIGTVTGYGFTMAGPCACRTPARLIEIPEICFSTYRSCSTRTVERSMRRPLAAMTSTTTPAWWSMSSRSEEHTSELQSQSNLVCRLLLEKKKKTHSIQAIQTTTDVHHH